MDIATIIILLIYYAIIIIYCRIKYKENKNKSDKKLSIIEATIYLSAFSLTGSATYGFAGDAIKFGMTYLFWYPVSILLSWVMAGIFLSKPYFQMGGITIPAYIEKRYGKRTNFIASIANLCFYFFITSVGIYALASIIKAVVPSLSLGMALIFSFLFNFSDLLLSRITGKNNTSLFHWSLIFIVVTVSFIVIKFSTNWGWNEVVQRILVNYSQISLIGINKTEWLSFRGLGIGVISQFLIGEIGILGSISTISSAASWCRSEKEAKWVFIFTGILTIIPVILTGLLGIYSAAYLGSDINRMPIYSALGIALQKISPLLSGVVLTAFIAAIISSFTPIMADFSEILIENFINPIRTVPEKTKKYIFFILILIIGAAEISYLNAKEVGHILQFLYQTSYPCMIPITLVTLFGIYLPGFLKIFAFFSILLGTSVALVWSLVLHNPFGIPSVLISVLIPLLFLFFYRVYTFIKGT